MGEEVGEAGHEEIEEELLPTPEDGVLADASGGEFLKEFGPDLAMGLVILGLLAGAETQLERDALQWLAVSDDAPFRAWERGTARCVGGWRWRVAETA